MAIFSACKISTYTKVNVSETPNNYNILIEQLHPIIISESTN